MSTLQRIHHRLHKEGPTSTMHWMLRGLYQRGSLHLFLLLGWIRSRWINLKRYELFALRNRLLFTRPIRVQVEGSVIQIVPKGAEAAAIWSSIRFERYEIAFILKALQPGMVFCDIGANAGLFALTAAKHHPSVQVHAFEPCQWTFQVLQSNVQLNALRNVQTYRTALGNYIGEATLHVNAPGSDGLNTIGQPSHPDCQVVSQETVPITTLNAFLAEQSISQVDVMKVDVEGAELLVFQGARDLLILQEAPLILYEGYSWCTQGLSYHPVEIMWFLQDCGYAFFVLDSQTGKITSRESIHGYDAMIVAAKPIHFALIRGFIG